MQVAGRWCRGWGVRDTLAPLAYDCFWVVPRQSGGERRPESQSISVWHTTEEKTQDWLCSLEDISVPGLIQFSPVNLQKDYYQLCPQQPWECLPMLLHTRLACPLELQHAETGYFSSANKYSNNKWHQLFTNGIMSSKSNRIYNLKNLLVKKCNYFLIGFIFPAMIFQNTIYKGLGKEVT